MEGIIGKAGEKCREEGVRESYRFMLGQFRSYVEGTVEGEGFCWLCSGILQPKFLK